MRTILQRLEEWGIELIKKIKTNLTLKIFLITGLLLVFVCLISVLSMVKYVPETYTNQLSASLQKQAGELAGQLETKSNLEDCYELIEQFSVKTEAAVFIKNGESDVLYSSSEPNEGIFRDSIATVQDNNTIFKITENELLSELSFPFTLQNSNEQYLLSVQGTSCPVNQAIIAIQETIPLIILGIVLLSILCAVFYSRYITKPILELSRVSEK